jgi:nucleotide-binding universal stress UspA family protein
MYRLLLVPLDGSPLGEQALPFALSIARRADAAVEIAHVHTPFQSYGFTPSVTVKLDEQAKEDVRTYLDGVVNRAVEERKFGVTSNLLVGDAAQALHDHAVSHNVDLVVMTTHGRGPLSRFWLGSVANELMRRMPMPVLMVRAQESVPEAGKEPNFQHLLIPLDGSELAEQILESAIGIGSCMGARYTLLRVVEPLILVSHEARGERPGGINPSMLAQLRKLHDEDRTEAQSYLDKIADRFRAQSLNVDVRVVSSQQPAAAILDTAIGEAVDLIALATHGRGGLSRVFFGSVADKVVRGTTIPVLVYRPQVK